MKKNSIKHSRINGEIQKALSKIISEELKDPRVGLMTSVTGAEVATDLKTCKVYVSVYGSDEEKAAAFEGLRSAEGFLRSRLAKTVNLRNTPELRFVKDESLEYGSIMSKMIERVISEMPDRTGEETEEVSEEA